MLLKEGVKMLTPEELKQATEEFKDIFQEEFGMELSDEDATEKAMSFLQLFDCLTEAKKV